MIAREQNAGSTCRQPKDDGGAHEDGDSIRRLQLQRQRAVALSWAQQRLCLTVQSMLTFLHTAGASSGAKCSWSALWVQYTCKRRKRQSRPDGFLASMVSVGLTRYLRSIRLSVDSRVVLIVPPPAAPAAADLSTSPDPRHRPPPGTRRTAGRCVDSSLVPGCLYPHWQGR
jgi:hypothetical protein